ncbi:MAG: DNA polymerase IV [Flavobacteriales bacterium]|nr:DNA polymerase IV [Flavobacteriales bacterium]
MEKKSSADKKIIHIDMDAFYASVEQKDHPEYLGKPIAVGGSSRRGVVAAASYEARKFGVHSAMPSVTAARKCPDLIFVKARFDRYREFSEQIREIFYEYTDLVEPLSLDEAYLDVTYNKQGISSAIKIAMLIREEIKSKTGLTASAGVSFNKFLAKTASDLDKPDGLSVILPEQAIPFLKQLKVEKFHGIGKKTAEKMHAEGIFTGEDLMKFSKTDLIRKYGKSGKHYFNIVNANDQREVKPNRIRKSIGAERTFSEDLKSLEEAREKVDEVQEKLMERLKKSGRKARTITLKFKYSDFTIRNRSKSLDSYTDDEKQIRDVVNELLPDVDWEEGVRLLGISLSQLDEVEADAGGQLTLTFE